MMVENLTLDGRVVSAPLASVSGSAYRAMARRFGAALVVSEMISVEGLVRGNRKTINMLRFRNEERPVSIQLFGRNPDTLGEACRIVADSGADMIDINLGCPARKIVKKCGGAALLRDLKRAESLFTAAVRAVSLPVSVKFRSGWDSDNTNFIELGKIAEDCGIALLTLHPRTRSTGFSGKADWSQIARLKSTVSIPVVGNGDITCPQDAVEMIDTTGCDMVMIGRAAMGAPWVFKRVDSVLRSRSDPGEPNLDAKIDICLQFVRLLIEDFGERSATYKMRKQLTWFTRGWKNIAAHRPEMFKVESYDDIVALFDRYRENYQRQSA